MSPRTRDKIWRDLERHIQNKILDYLNALPGCFAWEHFNEGIYRPSIRSFVKNTKYRPHGIPDIIGVYRGRFIAIEVKTLRGKVSDPQRRIITKLEERGGHVTVCRSLGEAQEFMEKIRALAA